MRSVSNKGLSALPPEQDKMRDAPGTGAKSISTEVGARRRLASVVDDQAALAGFSRVRVAMVLTDPRVEDNPIVYVNSAFERTTGYSRSAVVGRNCRFLQGEETRKSDVDSLRDAIGQQQDVTVDILNYRADGKPFMNRLIIAPIIDAEGQVIYFLGIQKELYDSEREEAAAEELLHAIQSRVRDDLSLVLAGLHELSDHEEPLAFEAMERRLECLQLVYESIQLSDQNETALGIDLGALISRVGAAVAHEESRPGIRYVQNVDPMQVNLEAAVRVALLLSEVLSNAFHHAFERMVEGFVELRLTRLAAGGLRIIVTDDGVGLPANAPFPNSDATGGRLILKLCDGLDATVTPVRGAAGTVVMIDVPVGTTEL